MLFIIRLSCFGFFFFFFRSEAPFKLHAVKLKSVRFLQGEKVANNGLIFFLWDFFFHFLVTDKVVEKNGLTWFSMFECFTA